MIQDIGSNSLGDPSLVEDTEGNHNVLSAPCIYFQCPFGCSAIYPKASIDDHMHSHLKRVGIGVYDFMCGWVGGGGGAH